MELDKILKSRRSIRKYKDQAVADDAVKQLIESSVYTASPSNTCPVRFINIKSQEIKDKLKSEMQSVYHDLLKRSEETGNINKIKNKINFYWRYSEFIFNAPVLLAAGICENKYSFSKNLKDANIINDDLITESSYDLTLGLALQNISLKAEDLKLGVCILTAPLSFLKTKIEDLLSIKDFKTRALISLGYADEVPAELDKKSLGDIYREI
jgi:nitroreductase